MKVAWDLIGGPCAGWYLAESTWPPPDVIRAVFGGGLLGDGAPAVLDLPGDALDPGEQVMEYELHGQGLICGRSRVTDSGMYATYAPAGWTKEQINKALRRSITGIVA